MNTAIIVAAGSGQRFDPQQPKQFADLLGKPLIIHTLEKFENCSAVDEIVLVLSADAGRQFEISKFRSEILKLKDIVIGGASRAESVRNGLNAINAATANIIAVHDGARPLVTVDEISKTINKADETGAACVVAEVTDTIKEMEGKHIIRTIDRHSLRRALTPQAFRYDILKRAFEGVELDDSITDECSLVENIGVEITCIEGRASNIKITRAEDLILAETLLIRQKRDC